MRLAEIPKHSIDDSEDVHIQRLAKTLKGTQMAQGDANIKVYGIKQGPISASFLFNLLKKNCV